MITIYNVQFLNFCIFHIANARNKSNARNYDRYAFQTDNRGGKLYYKCCIGEHHIGSEVLISSNVSVYVHIWEKYKNI